jgi:hypothetical protein
VSSSEVLTVTPGYSGKGKRTWYSFNSPVSTYEYLVHNSSLVNVVRGLVERVFCVVDKSGELVRPPKPVPGAFNAKLGSIGRQLSKTVGHCHHWTRRGSLLTLTMVREGTHMVVLQRHWILSL